MRCYVHPTVPAVGLCSVCRRGVCKDCQVVLEGKRFCKRDAEMQLEKEERTAASKKRAFEVSLAAVIAFLDGMAGMVVGFLLALIGILGPSARSSPVVATTVAPFLNYFAAVLEFSSTNAVSVGLIALALGCMDVAAGYYLWQNSRAAGVLAIVTAVAGAGLISSYLVILALAGVFVFVWVISAVVKIGLILYRWGSLG